MATVVPQGQQQLQLNPQLLALLGNFAAAAASSNNINPEPIPPAAAAAANQDSSSNDGNVSGSSGGGGSDLALELSGRPPVIMYIPDSDERSLSEYQCLVRKQIELFEANEEDVECQVRSATRNNVLPS